MNTSTEEPWNTDSNRIMKENKNENTKNVEKCQFCTQTRTKKYMKYEISEKYNGGVL